MELARAIRALAKRPWLVAAGVLIAAVAAMFSVYTLSGGKLKARSLQYSSASTQVIVDAQRSVLGSVTQSFEPLAQRAWVYANFMTSPTFLGIVGQPVGLSGAQIYAAGPLTVNEPRIEQEPTELKRNAEITGETKPYRLSYEAQTGLPTITINSQAPTTKQAVALANSAAAGLQSYVAHSESTDGIPRSSRIVIRQLGPASGAVVDGGISKALASLVFIGVFLLWCILVLYATRFREVWRESAAPLVGWDKDWSEAADGEVADRSKETGIDVAAQAPHGTYALHPESRRFDALSGGEDTQAAAVPGRRRW
jgi:hypothetical protein